MSESCELCLRLEENNDNGYKEYFCNYHQVEVYSPINAGCENRMTLEKMIKDTQGKIKGVTNDRFT